MQKNTLVVFCSDNGPVLDDGYQDGAVEMNGDHRAAGPYTGGKYSVYEGGTRTPFICRWPGKIVPGVSGEMVCTIDLSASLARLTGAKLQPNDCVDSFDVMDALLGKDGALGRDHLVQQNNGTNGIFGYRRGDWKLVRHDNCKSYNKVVEIQLKSTSVPNFQLFNLKDDPSESKNLLNAEPEIAERMKSELTTIIKNGRSRN